MKSTITPESNLEQNLVRFEIAHTTCYTYEKPRLSSVMSLNLMPRKDRRQNVDYYQLRTDPSTFVDSEIDYFGNTRHFLDLHRPHQQLTIESVAKVWVNEVLELDKIQHNSNWEEIAALQDSIEYWEYLQHTNLTRTKVDLVDWVDAQGGIELSDPESFLETLCVRLSQVIRYQPGSTTIESTVDDLLKQHEGVCQDIAQLMIAIARTKGIPSRYVMGYLYVSPGESHRLAQNTTHAWVECYLPHKGWTSFDPTNPDLPKDSHIVVSYGRDYRDVAPTKGISLGTGDATMDVSVTVLKDTISSIQ